MSLSNKLETLAVGESIGLDALEGGLKHPPGSDAFEAWVLRKTHTLESRVVNKRRLKKSVSDWVFSCRALPLQTMITGDVFRIVLITRTA